MTAFVRQIDGRVDIWCRTRMMVISKIWLWTARTSAALLVMTALAGCSSKSKDPSENGGAGSATATKARVAGSVRLEAIDELDRLDRVKVTLTPDGEEDPIIGDLDEAGGFFFQDVEPGAHVLQISYGGTLLGESDGESAYKRFRTRVEVGAGATNLGLAALELGEGSVRGEVDFGGDDSDSAAVVRLEHSQSIMETPVVDGKYSFPVVPVGNYQLVIQREGYAACSEAAVVAWHEQKLTSPLSMASRAVSFAPSAKTQVNVVGDTWYLLDSAKDSVDISVTASFASQSRVWLEGDDRPTFSAFDAGKSVKVSGLDEGATLANLQFTNDCGFVSDPYSLTMVRDASPPTINFLALNNGIDATRNRTVALNLGATDAVSQNLQMRVALCDVVEGEWSCEPSLSDAPWKPYAFSESVTFSDTPGMKGVQVEVRDPNDNRAPMQTALVEYDPTPPTGVSLTVDDILVGGSGGSNPTVHSQLPMIEIAGEGIAEMKVGFQAGLSGVRWSPYQEAFRLEVPAPDGPKTLYARFRDAAGNETVEFVIPFVLDTSGVAAGTFLTPTRADNAGVRVALLGTALQTTTDSDGTWSISGVPEGTYALEATAEGHRTYRFPSLAILANETVDLGSITLEDLQARIVGQVQLEGWIGQLQHQNVLVTVRGTDPPLSALSDATGSFILPVPPTNYPDGLEFSRDGYHTYVRADPIAVVPDSSFNIGVIEMNASSNALRGRVLVDNAVDNAGVEVTVTGEAGTPAFGFSAQQVTGADGVFSWPALQLGSYSLRLERPGDIGREVRTLANLRVQAGPATALDDIHLRTRYLRINDDAQSTNQNDVLLYLGASDCAQLRVGNQADLSGQPWQSCVEESLPWTLPGTDGTKTVYAQFRTTADPENPTPVISDTIELDTEAQLQSCSHNRADVDLRKGQVVRFTLQGEPGGSAHVAIAEYDTNIVLYDNGLQGDTTANDGIYGRDYIISLEKDVRDTPVTCYFTDATGNPESLGIAPLTVVAPAIISGIEILANVDVGSITVRWSTNEPTTGVVGWGTALYSYPNTEPTTPLGTEHEVTLGAGELVSGVEYFLKINAYDTADPANLTSAERSARLVQAKPAYVAAIPGIGRAWLRWEAPNDQRVLGYNVYRATSPGGPFTKLNSTPFNHEALIYRDDTVTNAVTYYYRVVAVDLAENEGVASDVKSCTPQAASDGPTDVSGGAEGEQVWSEIHAPYRLTDSFAVGKNQPGGLLVVGPNTDVLVTPGVDAKIIVHRRSRLAVLGERSTESDLLDEGNSQETEDGMARFLADLPLPADPYNPEEGEAAGTEWAGIEFEADDTTGTQASAPRELLDINRGAYLAGNIFYRARISHATPRAILTHEAGLAFLRSIGSFNRGSASNIRRGVVTVLGGERAPDLLVENSRFEGNSSLGFWNDGAGVTVLSGQALVQDSEFIGNRAQRHGVSAYCTGGTMTLLRNRFRDEVAGNGVVFSNAGCQMRVVDSTFLRNDSDSSLIVHTAEEMILTGSVFADTVDGCAVRTGGNQGDRGQVWSSVFINSQNTARCDGVDVELEDLYSSTFGNVHATTRPSLVETDRFWRTQPVSTRYSHWLEIGPGNAVRLRSLNEMYGNSFPYFDGVSATAGLPVIVQQESSHPDLPAEMHYWGALSTTEIEGGAFPQQVSAIWDYQDEIELAQVDYRNHAVSALPMPRITSPRWGLEVQTNETVVFEGYGYDLEDSSVREEASACAEWVSLDGGSCDASTWGSWNCERCPVAGPDICDATCYVANDALQWCADEDCTVLLGDEDGKGTTEPMTFDTPGVQRVWLQATDSDGQTAVTAIEITVTE